MGCRKRYKYKQMEPCATWCQKVSSHTFLSDFTDLDPRMGEIRQVYTSLYHFDIFASEFQEITRILRFQKRIVEMWTFP